MKPEMEKKLEEVLNSLNSLDIGNKKGINILIEALDNLNLVLKEKRIEELQSKISILERKIEDLTNLISTRP